MRSGKGIRSTWLSFCDAFRLAWVFGGLEMMLTSALYGALKESATFQLINVDIGLAKGACFAGIMFGAVGTGIGSIASSAIFEVLIEAGSRDRVFAGYLFRSFLMIAVAMVAWRLCISAESQPVESIAVPCRC